MPTPAPSAQSESPPPPSKPETIRYSIGGSKPVTVEVKDGKGVVDNQRDADTLNAAVDGVNFTVAPAEEK